MSYCTIALIKGGTLKLQSVHYTEIHNILSKWINKLNFEQENDDTDTIIYGYNHSDTGIIPAVIIDFNKKQITSTKYNWFDFYDKDVPEGWTFKEETLCVKVTE